MKPKAIIRSRKRFLIANALLLVIVCLSFSTVPINAQSPKIVYVVIAIDSEMWGGHDPYLGSTNPHPTMDMRSYSRTSPLNVAAVFDSNFRNSRRDSFGNTYRMTWFAEMDYLMAKGNFVYGDGTPAGVSGYTTIRDMLMNNWGAEIQTYSDSIEYHHHFMIYDGSWKRYDNGPDAAYPDYQMYALDHMIIDRNFYPSTYRSGWLIMPPVLSSWLEQWMPFDYTPTTGLWNATHPSGMSRWQTTCTVDLSQADVNNAFARALSSGSALYAFYCHDREDIAGNINTLQGYLNTADADEATYPDVSFKYVSAREAMQRALGFTDFTPPTFTITSSGNTYTIVSSEPLWGSHPYIALKYTNGTYGHVDATPTDSNTWTVTFTQLPPLETIGVAGSDLYGNPGVACLLCAPSVNVVVSSANGGTTNPVAGQYQVAQNSVFQVSAAASSGYTFDHWVLDGVNVGSDKSYSFNVGTASHTISPIFAQLVSTQIASCDSLTSWSFSSATGSVDNRDFKEGTGSIVVSPTGSPLPWNIYAFLTPPTKMNFAHYSKLEIWINASDSTKQLELMVATDWSNYNVYRITGLISNGWAKIAIDLSTPTARTGTVNFNSISFIQFIYQNAQAAVSLKIDDIRGIYAFVNVVVSSANGGTTNPVAGQYQVAQNSVFQVSAAASSGYTFDHWVLDGVNVGSDKSYSFNVGTASHTVSPIFAVPMSTVTVSPVSPSGSGTTSPVAGEYQVAMNSNFTVSATASSGYAFDYWVLDGVNVGSANPYSFNVTGNLSITATFTQNAYTLTVSTVGNGSVVKVPDQASYRYGDSVQLAATPTAGWSFSAWSGDLTGSTNPTLINMASDKAVTATFTIGQYSTITASAGAGGVISPSGSVPVNYGEDITFTITPNIGYHVADVIVDGSTVGAVVSYTFTAVQADHSIAALFAINQFTISASAGLGGVIDPSGSVVVNYGGSITFTITSDVGYSISDVIVDSSSLGPVSAYTFSAVIADHTISASFTINQYTITASAGAGGSITPVGSVLVNYGEDKTFTIAPETGYHIFNVVVDGSSVGAVSSYTFIAVSFDHTVFASFAINEYTISASADAGGSISPSGAIPVAYGESKTFIITPDDGYHIADVLVDSVSVGAVSEYTFSAVYAGHTISASFTQIEYTLSVAVSPDGSGSVSKNPDYTHYHYSDVVLLTAAPSAGYTFSSWSGGLSGNPTSVTVAGDMVVTAYFTQIEYTLAVSASPAEGGSVTKSPDLAHYHYNDVVELTAVPNAGWSLIGWSGGLVGNPTSVTITSDTVITAYFTQNEYILTVITSPTEGGSVIKNPNQATYHYNDVVELTAAADAGYSFTSWSGGFTGNPTSVTITGDTAVTAYFTLIEYTLDVTTVGSGSVSKSPDQPTHHYNEVVELTATADPGWSFSGWSGDLTGSNNPAILTITGDMSVTATFANQIAWTITASAGTGGSIYPIGAVTVADGTNQLFTITPDSDYAIADVVVDGVSQGAVSEYTFIAVAMDHTIVASFIQGTYTITASVDGVGGTIAPSGAVAVNGGEDKTFTLTPDTGYHILNVMADGVYMGPQASYTFFSVDSDHTITAFFAKNEYALTIIIVGPGRVSINPNKISYSYGDIVEITATPNSKKFKFDHWGGDLTGNTNPATITIDSNKTVYVYFTKI